VRRVTLRRRHCPSFGGHSRHREADTIGRTLEALLAVDYPSYEVIVVNDGSPENTAAVVRRYVHTGVVRLLDKTVNEGKAMGLNDALPLSRGEIVVVLDADIVVTPGVLRALVPHFETSRVGAVTGNPRVANRGSLLRNLQTLEFASIVSVHRRAQRIWGRVLTVSGAIAAFRKTVLVDVGLFSPDMATEDIEHDLDARGGALRETGSEWQPLGMGRASVERDVSLHWGVRLDGGWSNSNLTGSAGFQRTSLSLGVTIRP